MTVTLSDDQIVTLAVREGKYSWYVSERDYWVLDYRAWERAFREAGYDLPEAPDEERFGMPVVDEHNAGDFLRRMEPWRIETEKLRGARASDGDDALPALLVDFDNRTIIVGPQVESPAFEEYLPSGWVAKFDGILDAVPVEARFWR